MQARLGNVNIRIVLVALIVGTVVGVSLRSWIPEVQTAAGPEPGQSGVSVELPDRPVTPPPPPPPPRRSSASAKSSPDTARPRLFLARDRVKRLPELEVLADPIQTAGCADETDAASEGLGSDDDGPRLFSPGGAMPDRITARPLDQPIAQPLNQSLAPNGLTAALSRSPRQPPPIAPEDARVAGQSFAPAGDEHRRSPTAGLEGVPMPGPEGVVEAPDAQPPAEPERSEQLERIARQADRHTREAFDLAGRKAYYAARAEFIVALRLVAQALDAEEQTARHSEALAAGLRAIREADDFLPTGSRLEADLDLPTIIQAHRTPVLRETDPATLTPMLALRRYFTFAQRQLAEACGGELAGSMALHGLGKLHAALVREPTVEIVAAEPKAMTFFQAALLVFPNNLMAANDLGVLLARSGNWEQARRFLEHAVAVNPQSVSWKNLEKVYRQLGEPRLAEHAHRQVAELQQRGGPALAAPSRGVLWMRPGEFAATHARYRGEMPTARNAQQTPPAPRR